MKKISAAQLLFILFFLRGFLSITYESSRQQPNNVIIMLSLLLSLALQFLLVLPVVAAADKFPGKDILQLYFERSKTAGIIFSAVYLSYFVFEGINLLGAFSYFLKNYFFEYFSHPAIIAILAAAALYASVLGPQAIARAAAVTAVIFAGVLLIIIFGVTGEFDLYNLQYAVPKEKNLPMTLMREIYDSVGRSAELAALVFLLPRVEKQRKAGTFGYLAVKLAFVELTAFLITAVLGNYAKGLSMPFYTLTTYAKSSVIERYDSIYMLVWTIAVFIKASVLFYIGGLCLKNIFPKLSRNAANTTVASVCAAAAAVLALLNKWDSLFFRTPSAFVIIALASALPLVTLFFKKRRDL